MKLVVIGNGPAAIKAIEAISANCNAEKSEKLEITVISTERVKPYAPMFLLDYVLGKRQKRELDLAISADHLPVNKILGKRAIGVETHKNKVLLDDGEEVEYDKLLIASGASPVKPDIKGIEKKGVYFLNRLADAQKLSRCIKSVDKVLVIGGGTIGTEAAVAFREAGKKVTIVELLEHVLLPVFDKDIVEVTPLFDQAVQ